MSENITNNDGQVLDVEISSDNEHFVHAVSYGDEEEGLSYAPLIKWSVIGIATVVVLVVGLIFFSQFSFTNALRTVSESSTHYEIVKLNEEAEATLNSFGVVDLEEGVYHIPIDEAINKLAVD